ncbi:MAG: hypothetical protein ABII64_00940 [Elusimicrobiota bacterium]
MKTNQYILKLVVCLFISCFILGSCHNNRNVNQSGGYNETNFKTDINISMFSKISKLPGLEDYLKYIQVDLLRKVVAERDLNDLKAYLEEYSKQITKKDFYELSNSIKKIRKIIPADPYFRVIERMLRNVYIDDYKKEQIRIVQVIRWDWEIDGQGDIAIYVNTGDSEENIETHGPYTNNTITMLDFQIRRYIQFQIKSKGGYFKFYPTTIRLGWTIAKINEKGEWIPMIAFAEYDPYFRINKNGDLEY